MYLGKGYERNGIFKLNMMTIINQDTSSFAYLIESSNLRYGGLGYVNYNSIQKLINVKYMPKLQIDSNYNCETSAETKLIRSLFQIVRNIEPLNLIYSDVCDLKFA